MNRALIIILFLVCFSDAKLQNLIGVGYSKDIYQKDFTYNNTNQAFTSYDALWNTIGCGFSFRYYNAFMNDDRRLIYAQWLADVGYLIKAWNIQAKGSAVYGYWEREKSISAIEQDSISSALLHVETNESSGVGNLYRAFGIRLKMWYNLQIFNDVAIAPAFSAEILRNWAQFVHNKMLVQGEKRYGVYLSAAICIKF